MNFKENWKTLCVVGLGMAAILIIGYLYINRGSTDNGSSVLDVLLSSKKKTPGDEKGSKGGKSQPSQPPSTSPPFPEIISETNSLELTQEFKAQNGLNVNANLYTPF